MILLRLRPFAVYLLAIAFALASKPAKGDTIISVQGPINLASTFQSGLPPEPVALQMSWTQTSEYEDVSVFASLGGFTGDSGTAYLTTSSGPGTTPSDEVTAPNDFTFPSVFIQPVELFSGLTLGPGTYFLTLYGDGLWDYTASPTFTLDAGVSEGLPSVSNDLTFPTYVPAADYTFGAAPLVFEADGNPVPEPSQLAVLITLILGAGVFWRRTVQQ